VFNEAAHSVQLPLSRLCNADLRPDGIVVLAHLLTHHIMLGLNSPAVMCMALLQAVDLSAVPASCLQGGFIIPACNDCLHPPSKFVICSRHCNVHESGC